MKCDDGRLWKRRVGHVIFFLQTKVDFDGVQDEKLICKKYQILT